MFKLPALKPYGEQREPKARLAPTLESTDEFKGSNRKQTWQSAGGRTRSACSDPDAYFNPPIKTRTWQLQADEVMADSTSTEKFRSLAVYAEMKLQEVLEKCSEITPPQARKSEHAPDRFRAACCLQLLSELCMFVGPFENTLAKIKEELARSIYSEYYASQEGDLAFDQIPWFAVADKLENEKRVMVADKEKFTVALMEHQEAMKRVDAQVAMLQLKLREAEVANTALRIEIEVTKESEKKAVLEGGGLKEELKRARKEIMRLKDEKEVLQSEFEEAKAEATENEDSLRLRMEHLKRQAADAEEELRKSEALRQGLVHASLVQAAEEKVMQLEAELQVYKDRADEARLDRIKEVMTPRVNWKALDPFSEGPPPAGTSSKDIIKRMVKRLKKQEDGMPTRKVKSPQEKRHWGWGGFCMPNGTQPAV